MVNEQEIPIITIQSDSQTLCFSTEIENKGCENNLPLTNIQYTDKHLSCAQPTNINLEIENDLNLNYVVGESVEGSIIMPSWRSFLVGTRVMDMDVYSVLVMKGMEAKVKELSGRRWSEVKVKRISRFSTKITNICETKAW